jgi:hypothetical protein
MENSFTHPRVQQRMKIKVSCQQTAINHPNSLDIHPAIGFLPRPSLLRDFQLATSDLVHNVVRMLPVNSAANRLGGA